MAKSPHDTPAMRQFRRFKQQHPDCVLLFRMGDFYELFYDDAETASTALGLALTQRTEGIPMAGVPFHQLDTYLRRLIQAGYRVAVCDQVEDAAQAKGLVKRDVTRVVTPGTLTDEALLDEGVENRLAAVRFADDEHAAVALAELSTGAFEVAAFDAEALVDELARLAPSELLYVETATNEPPDRVATLAERIGATVTPRPAWQFRVAEATETLCKQFGVSTLEGFGIDEGDATVGPAGAVVSYLLETQQATDGRLAHLRPPRRYERHAHLVIDPTSLRALEVERTMRSGERAGSLLATLDSCRTAMGKRMLRRWLCYPLRDREQIEARQDMVAALVAGDAPADDLNDLLSNVQDVERMASRIAVGRPSPRDVVATGSSVAGIEQVIELLADSAAFDPLRQSLQQVAPPLVELAEKINAACTDSPPAHLREGGLIRDGFDAQLDEYRSLQRDGNAYLADYQKQLVEETGIANLKVGYNKVFGYYIEVSRAQSSKMPDRFTRKQTLKNAERYITPQLKEYEDKVLGAATKAIAREQHLFDGLVDLAKQRLEPLAVFAEALAALDVVAAFARRATRFRYVRPTIVDKPVLKVTEGRHPVLDELLADQFVSNDVALGVGGQGSGVRSNATEPRGPKPEACRATLALITGPNMAGKSTYIRQAALLTLMAHTGSFVPAAEATVGLTDRIFTRVGASDELHAGQSTFMVEMVETANICHHVTDRSMVILDEIGRGTSTYDGLSLAWAIAEHLAGVGARTLFATHYHELTALADALPNVGNLNVAVREWADEVVFLHRIQPGGTDRSYGIHVAKIAGLPPAVIDRARGLMHDFEKGGNGRRCDDHEQMDLFTEFIEHPAVGKLRSTDLNELSPLEAFDLLRKLKEELGD